MAGKDYSEFFSRYIYSAADFEVPIKEAFKYLDISFVKEPSKLAAENFFGFKTIEMQQFSKVSLVAPYSPAWNAGIFAGDEIIAVNNQMLRNNLDQLLHYYLSEDTITLSINSNERLKDVLLHKDKKGNTFFFTPAMSVNSTGQNSEAFKAWKHF